MMEQNSKSIEELKFEQAWLKTFRIVKDVAIKQAQRKKQEEDKLKAQTEKSITFISTPE